MIKGLFSNLNLAKKLTISFLTLALIPIVIVTAIAMKNMYNERMETVNQHNLYVAQMKAGSMDNILMNQIQFMGALYRWLPWARQRYLSMSMATM